VTDQIIILLLFLPIFSGAALLSVLRAGRRRQFVHHRLNGAIGKSNEPITRLSLVRRTVRSPNVVLKLSGSRLNAAFEATGNRVGLPHLIISGVGTAVIVVEFASQLLALNTLLVILFAGIAAGAAPVILLNLARGRYQNQFLEVFPDALDIVARGVKSGLPVSEALAVAAREISDPVGSELRRALDQMQIGVQMTAALREVADRIRVADFHFLVVTLALQQKTGGSLAETLVNLSTVIRGRKALRLKSRSLSAEARTSGAVLAVLPFLVGAAMYLMNRDMALPLFVDERGRFMLGVAAISLGVGLTAMAVMVKRALR
jgi:tight adherence protein B